MDYTVEEIVSLIYSWLKEKHLLKTSQTLEQEYGKSIPEHSGPTLANIIQTYQSLALLLSSFNSQTQKVGNIPEQACTESSNKVSNVSKRNKKSAMKKDVSTKNSVDEKKIDYSKTNKVKPSSTENEGKTKDPIKKEKKKPFMPPGEWVCPQMEDALSNVYERNRLSILPIATDNIGNEVADHSLPAAPNVIEETISYPISDVCNKKKTCDGNAGTSDSESDSSNDDFEPTKKTKNTLVKLSNGVTLESPYTSNKQTLKEITKDLSINESSIQNNKPEKSIQKYKPEKSKKLIQWSKNDKEKPKENGGIKFAVESNDDLLGGESGELNETMMNKSRRKSKKLFHTIPPMYDDINNEDDFISKESKKKKMEEHVDVAAEQNSEGECEMVLDETTMNKSRRKSKKLLHTKPPFYDDSNNEDDFISKKSKKKNINKHIDVAGEQNGECETATKKKKKKRGIDIDVTGNDDTIHEYEITKKKKKKKEKVLEENEITQNSDECIYIKVKKKKKQTEFDEAETDIPLDLNKQTVIKKKKKRKAVD